MVDLERRGRPTSLQPVASLQWMAQDRRRRGAVGRCSFVSPDNRARSPRQATLGKGADIEFWDPWLDSLAWVPWYRSALLPGLAPRGLDLATSENFFGLP